jgi:hypothetical protein
MGILPLARMSVELAEPEVAMCDEWAHATGLCERQRLAVVDLTALSVEPVGVGRDVPEQVLRMGHESRLRLIGVDRPVAQVPRLVEPAKQQAGATQRVVDRAAARTGSRRIEALDELLAFPEPVQRFAGLPLLRQDPGGGCEATKHVDDVRRPEHRDRALDQWARLSPVTLPEVAPYAKPIEFACCVASASPIISDSY